jgi:uncharacterized protein (TIGR00369 family)
LVLVQIQLGATMDTSIEKRIKDSFARQTAMATIGASITAVSLCEVTSESPFRSDLTQQHGFLHAGVVTMLVDTACGYAALTQMPTPAAVLTAEYKVNFLSPAEGDRLIARGRVVKAGRILTVCFGKVYAIQDGKQKLVATMIAREETGLRD